MVETVVGLQEEVYIAKVESNIEESEEEEPVEPAEARSTPHTGGAATTNSKSRHFSPSLAPVQSF